MRRLATQIHLTILVALALFAVLAAAAWVLGPGPGEETLAAGALGDTVAELLPGPDRPKEELQAAVARLSGRLGLNAAVFSPQGERLASFGEPLPFPRWRGPGKRILLGGRPDLSLRLPDGRVVVAARPRAGLRAFARMMATLGLLSLAVGIAAWPLVQRLTRRLERLRQRVDDLGRGDLSVRAAVEGRDEVADLARSFNRAADRIQQLVEAERRQLAFASHELRSPLARLRVSLELLGGDPELNARAAQDVAELDGLIGELLEASRLQARPDAERRDAVDLLALAAEEAARTGAEVSGQAVTVHGDARLLRRLLRNLLENAGRHGGRSVLVSVAARAGGGALLSVSDDGPGVPASQRERVFEPFYRPPGAAETGAGYGLGLALVRQIARAHGGEARYLEREGGGSVFEVEVG